MKHLLVILTLLLVSCGTRKVETDKTNLKHDSTIIKQNINSIDSVVTNIMRRFVIESRKTADSIVVTDSKVIYYNVIQDIKQTDSTKVDSTHLTRYDQEATNKVESVVLKEKNKQSERVNNNGIYFFIIIGFALVFWLNSLRK